MQGVLSRSDAVQQVLALAQKVAVSSCAVLVTGESGTGKELVARVIHDASPRRSGCFIAVNAAAMPEDLVESQLFGHQRGAFTGADQDRLGAFRAASGGTLLLDEVADIPPAVQPKLLRAIEERAVTPVGADQPVEVDTRLVAATSRDLAAMVADGCFREDLLYRVRVVEIHIPPLRERPEDVLVLAEYYAGRHARELGKSVPGFAPEVRRRLLAHPWYGNVRELSNVIEHAVLLNESGCISVADLPGELCCTEDAGVEGMQQAVDSFRCRHIKRVLELTGGNRGEAARVLGISHATLFRYIERYDLKGYGLGKTIEDSQ